MYEHSCVIWCRLQARWSDKSIRKDIYQAINDAMRGKWAQAAMQETGSIVCQNIFESADDTEKVKPKSLHLQFWHRF